MDKQRQKRHYSSSISYAKGKCTCISTINTAHNTEANFLLTVKKSVYVFEQNITIKSKILGQTGLLNMADQDQTGPQGAV